MNCYMSTWQLLAWLMSLASVLKSSLTVLFLYPNRLVQYFGDFPQHNTILYLYKNFLLSWPYRRKQFQVFTHLISRRKVQKFWLRTLNVCKLFKQWLLIGFTIIFRSFKLHFQPFHANLEAVHSLYCCLGGNRVIVTNKTWSMKETCTIYCVIIINELLFCFT